MLTLHTGDLFTSGAHAIGQGVNAEGVMGAGIAVEFKRRWPSMFLSYALACREGSLTPGGVHFGYDDIADRVIVNIVSQDLRGRNATLEWLESGLRAAIDALASGGRTSLALPRIGCGIGGLNYEDVEPLLRRVAEQTGFHIELWTLESDL